ncbi:MAG: L-lactate permease [Anaerovoracaceae bacterium]
MSAPDRLSSSHGDNEAVGDMRCSRFIGLIGSFITGSNMSSNILFTDVQNSAAASLNRADLCWPLRLGAAAEASSPSKIVLGSASAGEHGKEER